MDPYRPPQEPEPRYDVHALTPEWYLNRIGMVVGRHFHFNLPFNHKLHLFKILVLNRLLLRPKPLHKLKLLNRLLKAKVEVAVAVAVAVAVGVGVGVGVGAKVKFKVNTLISLDPCQAPQDS
ncbi:hypothetical protein PG987_010141 [Apiospora arundinis]